MKHTSQIALVIVLLMLTMSAWAEPEPAETTAVSPEPVAASELKTAPPPQPEEAPAAAPEEQPAATPEGEAPAEEEPAEEIETGGKSMVLISERSAVGLLGKDLLLEVGIQAEIAAPHFGVTAWWAWYQPFPDDVGFCYGLGFAFHWYPLGDGPGSLYFGPGFFFIHMHRDPDPIPAAMASTEVVDEWGLVKFNESGDGKDFDLLVPMLEVGYRYRFPFYLTLGVSLSVGYAVSDQRQYHGDAIYASLMPHLGFSW